MLFRKFGISKAASVPGTFAMNQSVVHKKVTSWYHYTNSPPQGGGGVLRISSVGDDPRIFLSLKFSIPRFFWVGKFGK